ncbi:molybdenum cofactor biosynthesis enzyme [Desulfitobacterium dichloroeliminans LMG P-21439]|uniref:Molybdenum cofactor biosynthesis enzyme n=1 Tax=Desulfitobacterium dichloroeliminans (strain LMG P-21439 / DCA1) TaxID=871963 RepID=L0FCC4_DESDL|nr:radical SAM protein [Desulfitobacterium dichloroeliminans]AGA70306.1 molybdenum cofactor biosynthesis enzyme [Desulfitobacterium dichloroeliminans LMG P-21439]
MRWTSKGHELDKFGEEYLQVEDLYIWGVSEVAKKCYDFLLFLNFNNKFNIIFLDKCSEKQNELFCGKKVFSPQSLLESTRQNAKKKAVILAFSNGQDEVRELLNRYGIVNVFSALQQHNRNDNFIQNFLCVWAMYKYGILISHWTNYCLTTRCNLNCKGCLNFTSYINNPRDETFNEFKSHIDMVFSKFDYLYSLHFSGGEPLLHKELPRFLDYISENYRERIFELFVITNGSIVPSVGVLKAIKQARCSVSLDDYSKNVPLCASRIESVKCAFENADIPVTLVRTDSWYDFEINDTDNSSLSEEEMIKHKDNCNSFLHDFYNGQIYGCCYHKFAQKAGIASETDNDYIDIASSSKMEILEFRQGFTNKGYVGFCRRCRGFSSNVKSIPCAIQIPLK